MQPDLGDLFPPSPASVPPGLTAPTRSYRRHAWLATGGLLTFVALYLGLTGYFGWVIYRLVVTSLLHGGHFIGGFFMALPAMFFFAFLLRGLFNVKQFNDSTLLELEPAEQPLLFAFLRRLAVETGAPPPHRVFLSARVNACVFYDLSIWNLLFPSKKNLELGLGLVNTLTLDELKAVIAHEYGHFAQRTMAVGRWVYVSQQIASHIVMARGGFFDTSLSSISHSDIRVAWIGWVMRVFVWALRALLDTGYRLVVLAHRALSREMEFQADRVAVAVSGSDSLVHALHKLGAADAAWEEGLSFSVQELTGGRPLPDLFELQTLALEHLRRILAQPDYGKTPARPSDPASHRVFQTQLAQPPRMWLTHPPNGEREDSAKATYLPSALDERTAWTLFSVPEKLRALAIAMLLKLDEPVKPTAPPVPGTPAERFALRFTRASLHPRYRGAYLRRSIAAHDLEAGTMIGRPSADDRTALQKRLAALYPASLLDSLTRYRERREEEVLLEGLSDGVLTAPGGVIRYRGREIRRKDLPGVISTVHLDRVAIEEGILAHDRECRAAHLDAARLLGNDWAEYLTGLVRLLHFATHTHRNIGDAHAHLQHVLRIVLAPGRVSSSGRERVLKVAVGTYSALVDAWSAKAQVVLSPEVKERFDAAGGWTALAEPLGLNAPNEQNLGNWLNVIDAWAEAATENFARLADATLDRLLEREEWVAARLELNDAVEQAPDPCEVPSKYQKRLVGQERKRQKQLELWGRFQAGIGLGPGAARAVVASALLLPAMIIGSSVGSSTVHVVNGLSLPVIVAIGGHEEQLEPGGTGSLELDGNTSAHVSAHTLDGREIERFDVQIGGLSRAVYNVAQAAPLVEWTAVYGTVSSMPDRLLGAPRWMDATQDAVFTRPPDQVSLKAGEVGYRTVLEAGTRISAFTQVEWVTNAAESQALVESHLHFDPSNSAHFGEWLALVEKSPIARPALLERLAREPDAVILLRAVMDSASPEEKATRCEALVSRARALAEDADAQYLAIRCQPQGEARDAAFRDAFEHGRKNPWLGMAVAGDYARLGQWKDAEAAWLAAMDVPAMAPFNEHLTFEGERTWRAARGKGVALTDLNTAVRTRPRPPGALDFHLKIDGPGRGDDPPTVVAARQLSQGKLTEAMQTLNADAAQDDGRAHLMALVAASDGADPKLVARVLAQPAAWFHGAPAVVLAALALREHQPAKELLANGPFEAPIQEQLLEILSQPTAEKATPELEKLAATLELKERGAVLAAAAVVFGDQAPRQWRQDAKAMLFPAERPWFR